MSDRNRNAGALRWRGPTIAWAIMISALVLIILLGLHDAGAVRFYGALALSAVMLLTLAFGLVGLARQKPPHQARRKRRVPVHSAHVFPELHRPPDQASLTEGSSQVFALSRKARLVERPESAGRAAFWIILRGAALGTALEA
jgi:hypothetical protein